MTLYEIGNGWTGESYVRVYVVAEYESQALALARIQFDAEAKYVGCELRALAAMAADRPCASAPSDSGLETRT